MKIVFSLSLATVNLKHVFNTSLWTDRLTSPEQKIKIQKETWCYRLNDEEKMTSKQWVSWYFLAPFHSSKMADSIENWFWESEILSFYPRKF